MAGTLVVVVAGRTAGSLPQSPLMLHRSGQWVALGDVSGPVPAAPAEREVAVLSIPAGKYDGVVSQVSGMDGVGNVNSLKKLLGPLFDFLKNMQVGAWAVALMLIVAAILQVSNTIRMTAYARRREIGIMRLVGASSWHIQLPFVLESLIAALLSAALAAAGLTAFMYFVVYRYLRHTLGQLTTWVSWHDALLVAGGTTVLALALALVPTLVMTRKYLDV